MITSDHNISINFQYLDKKNTCLNLTNFLFLFYSYFEDHLLRPVAMVSRRKILSRSRDDLNLDNSFRPGKTEEDDVWYAKEKLYKVIANSNIF
jgi:hypothetical protein